MEIRDFGTTGLRVSALGFGAGHIGSPNMSEDDAGRLLGEVLDLGINFIDTARGYGLSEERIGRHLSHRRDDFVLSSKCGYSVEGEADWTPRCIEKGIDRALGVLRTDRIDIMHFHSCPKDTLINAGIIEVLERARDAGKVRVVAYSGENDDLTWALDSGRFQGLQFSVNICDQRSADFALPRAAARGVGVIAKRPLANAFWRFAERPVGDYCETYWERARVMGLKPSGVDWTEFALRFAAYQPGVSTLIAGTSKSSNLAANAAAIAKGPLPADVIAETRRLFHLHDRFWTGQV